MPDDRWRVLEEQLVARFRADVEICDLRIGDVVLDNFPMTLGRIAWRKVPNSLTRLGLSVEQAAQFFQECVSVHHIQDAWIGALGDSMPYAFRTRVGIADELLKAIDVIGDHKYLFSLSGNWCFAYMMEGYAHFGMRPTNAKASRHRPSKT